MGYIWLCHTVFFIILSKEKEKNANFFSKQLDKAILYFDFCWTLPEKSFGEKKIEFDKKNWFELAFGICSKKTKIVEVCHEIYM